MLTVKMSPRAIYPEAVLPSGPVADEREIDIVLSDGREVRNAGIRDRFRLNVDPVRLQLTVPVPVIAGVSATRHREGGKTYKSVLEA